MKEELSKEVLRSKMYGGWIGKNIGGTLGGPTEGVMELLDIDFYTQEFQGPLENDDLDLQLVSLHAIEQYGARLTTKQLANEWCAHVYFAYDEYGHAMTNIRRNIGSPLAGGYNNFFTDCMGSPIRSEIWAMVAAGYPELATYYAYQDALVDHAGGEGVEGELFFAALESLAFYESNIETLVQKALAYIPDTAIITEAIKDVVRLYNQGWEWIDVRQYIIDQYATENPTYAPPNLAFTVLALLYGKDFSSTICTAVNCGYDTDCTAATAGAIWGIIHGAEAIPEEWILPIGETIKVSDPIVGFNPPRTIKELTDRTLDAREVILCEYRHIRSQEAFEISYEPYAISHLLPEGSFVEGDLRVTLTYEEDSPTLARNQKRYVKMRIENLMTCTYKGVLKWELPFGLIGSDPVAFELESGAKQEVSMWVWQQGEVQMQYPCRMCIEKYNYALLWTTYTLPVNFVPAMEWYVKSADQQEFSRLDCTTNQIEFDKVIDVTRCEKYIAKTYLKLPTERAVDLVVSTASGVKISIDGKCILECDEYTPCIPAYHRSSEKKRKVVQLEEGKHLLEIVVDKKDDEALIVHFMPVQPYPKTWYVDGFFGYYTDILMERE